LVTGKKVPEGWGPSTGKKTLVGGRKKGAFWGCRSKRDTVEGQWRVG